MSDKVVVMKRRNKQGLLLWSIVFIVMLIGVLYVVVGQARIQQIVVSGSSHYTRDEIIQMTGIVSETTVLDLFMRRKDRYDRLPYIKEIAIDYRSFNSIHIIVTEKEVISYIPYQNQYLALDKDGYIVGYETEKVMPLPSVTGLYFKSASLGEKLEVDEEVLGIMLSLYHLGNKYDVRLTNIDFVLGDAQMIHGYFNQVKIIMGSAEALDRKMKDAAEVLKKLDSSVSGTLDLQVDSDHYIFKETLDIQFYVAYGEQFLGVDRGFIIKKKGLHRMIDEPLIQGITVTSPLVGQSLDINETSNQTITLLLQQALEHQLQVDEIRLEDDVADNIEVMSKGILLRIGTVDSLGQKIQAAQAVMLQLEPGVSGVIDLRNEQENYTFQASDSD